MTEKQWVFYNLQPWMSIGNGPRGKLLRVRTWNDGSDEIVWEVDRAVSNDQSERLKSVQDVVKCLSVDGWMVIAPEAPPKDLK